MKAGDNAACYATDLEGPGLRGFGRGLQAESGLAEEADGEFGPVLDPLAGLVLEDYPGPRVGGGAGNSGQVTSRQAMIAFSSRSVARRAGTWAL